MLLPCRNQLGRRRVNFNSPFSFIDIFFICLLIMLRYRFYRATFGLETSWTTPGCTWKQAKYFQISVIKSNSLVYECTHECLQHLHEDWVQISDEFSRQKFRKISFLSSFLTNNLWMQVTSGKINTWVFQTYHWERCIQCKSKFAHTLEKKNILLRNPQFCIKHSD